MEPHCEALVQPGAFDQQCLITESFCADGWMGEGEKTHPAGNCSTFWRTFKTCHGWGGSGGLGLLILWGGKYAIPNQGPI